MAHEYDKANENKEMDEQEAFNQLLLLISASLNNKQQDTTLEFAWNVIQKMTDDNVGSGFNPFAKSSDPCRRLG